MTDYRQLPRLGQAFRGHRLVVHALLGTALVIGLTAATAWPAAIASAAPSGKITGQVTASGAGALKGVCVYGYDGGNVNPSQVTATTTKGTYTLTSLATGTYLVEFTTHGNCSGGQVSNYVNQWFSNKATRSGATQVTVTGEGTHTGVNAVMTKGGSISGKVAKAGTVPLKGICVGAQRVGTFMGSSVVVSTATTGTYTLTGLAAGTYDVSFRSTGFCPNGVSGNYVMQWYKDKANQSTATPVKVTAGATHTTVNATLAAAGSVSGKVTKAGTVPVKGICVIAQKAGTFMGSTTNASTNTTGTYTLTGVAPGTYDIEFTSQGFCPNGVPGNYVTQWYKDKATQSTATPVKVTAGTTHTTVNATMAAGGSITGKVTKAGTVPLKGICVDAQKVGTFMGLTANASTATTGTYTLTGLAAGTYDVSFRSTGFCPNGMAGNYVTQWYKDKGNQSTATPVKVTAGTTHATVDATLAAGGSISGRVTKAGTVPVKGICVGAQKVGTFVGTTSNVSTATTGTYTLTGLAAGTYDVSFRSTGFCPNGVAGNYVTQWYKDKGTQSTATPVTVTAGATHTTVNATMAAGGSITGKVTKAGTVPLGGICVGAQKVGTFLGAVPDVSTATTGVYTLTGLTPGTYDVEFTSQGFCPNGVSGNYVVQWYKDKANQSTATPVKVTSGATHTTVNATMAAGGSISGKVTKAGTVPLKGICVGAQKVGTFMGAVPNVSTTTTGTYTLTGLAAGTYDVYFRSTGGCPNGASANYVTQWYKDKANLSTATPVKVTAGMTHTTVNATLAAGGSISGRVAKAGTVPLEGICVGAQKVGTFMGTTSNVSTATTGTYTLTGLGPGTYVVSFRDTGFCFNGVAGNYVTQWYKDKASQSTATPVKVTSGTTHKTVNATLVSGGSISGKVIGVGTAPLKGICVLAQTPGTFRAPMANTTTGTGGTYTLSRLAAGTYDVSFTDTGFCSNGVAGNYVTQWYKDKASESTATPVKVGVGTTHKTVNATLVAGGSISGKVTIVGTVPLRGICVGAQKAGTFVGSPVDVSTAATGTYTLAGLTPGTYDVEIHKPGLLP